MPPTTDEALQGVRETKSAAGIGKPDYTKAVATFPASYRDPTTGKTLTGMFRSRVPRVHERDEIGLVAARLLGGVPWASVPPGTRASVQTRATLAVCLVEVPEWYKPDELYDVSILEELLQKVILHQSTFLRPGADSSGSTEPSAHRGGEAPAVVGREVPAAGPRG